MCTCNMYCTSTCSSLYVTCAFFIVGVHVPLYLVDLNLQFKFNPGISRGNTPQRSSSWNKFTQHMYFLSREQIIHLRAPAPSFPINERGSSRNTQYTFLTHHTRHSTYLHYVLRVSNVSSPTNDFLYLLKLVRVASAFDIRRRSDGGGDPPKKN